MKGARILIIEDEASIREPLADFLASEGFRVQEAASGEQGLELVNQQPPDLVLLDVMLPGLDGFSVCRKLRRRHPALPVIMLTARGEEEDRVEGLDLGADDYVVKPFGVRELAARIRARLRRRTSGGNTEEATRFRFGAICVDLAGRRVLVQGAPVELRAREWALLEYLVGRVDQVITREEILNAVWGLEHYPTTRTVDTHIYQLRQKLEPDAAAPRHFLTVHGLGYRLAP